MSNSAHNSERTAPSIRPARASDAPRLQQVEVATHSQFRAIGHDNVADDPPDSIEVLTSYAESGRSWVAVDGEGEAIGYALVSTVDKAAHIDQITVHPAHQGRGVGKALLEQAKQWARRNELPAMTLTTFSEVPWNRPLYEHLGFRVLGPDEVGTGLRAIQDHEAEKGFGPEGRVAMELRLGS